MNSKLIFICLVAGVCCGNAFAQLVTVTDSLGHPVTPMPESLSVSFLAGHTIGVMRDKISWNLGQVSSFSGAADTYQFKFAPGFQIAPQGGVELYTADVNAGASACQSINGTFSTSGDYAVNYTSTSSFQVAWEEQACLPKGAGGNPMNYGSVSAYALEITVLGPRGVSPWP